jgi:hypothetical protein
MTQRHTTVLGRELGWRLRVALQAAGLTGQEIAARLGTSTSNTSRMLTGHRGSDPAEVAAFLTICGVAGPARDAVVAVARENNAGRLRVGGAQRWISLREHIRQAAQVSEFAPAMLPWSVQVRGYTHAVADALGVAVDVASAWGGYRVRLVDLSPHSPTGMWSVLVPEWALRTPVGGPGVMAEQVHHLLRLSVQPAVDLRVIPVQVGQHAGMAGGATLLEFAQLPALVYREDATCGVLTDQRDDVQQAREMTAAVRRAALDAVESRSLLRRLALEWSGEQDTNADPVLTSGGVA